MFKPEIKDQAAKRIAANVAAQGGQRAYPMRRRVALALAEIDALALGALAGLKVA